MEAWVDGVKMTRIWGRWRRNVPVGEVGIENRQDREDKV